MRLRNDPRQQKEDERAQRCQRNGGRENGGSPALLPALLLKGGFLRRARALLRDGGERGARWGEERPVGKRRCRESDAPQMRQQSLPADSTRRSRSATRPSSASGEKRSASLPSSRR